jgi:dTDP-D-glucose 4,6-dehydratase
VRNAWVPLVFHHVSRRGADDRYSIETKTLHQLLDWLAARAGAAIVVRTIDEVAREPAPVPARRASRARGPFSREEPGLGPAAA